MTETPTNGLGSRLGHRPELHRLLAIKVLHHHLRNRHEQLAPPASDLSNTSPEDATLMVRAMIAAAHADGRLDEPERGRILWALSRTSLAEPDLARLKAEIHQPPPLEILIRQIRDAKQAARFYAVSLIAMNKSEAVNRAYMAYLARRLELPADQEVRLNRRFGMRR